MREKLVLDRAVDIADFVKGTQLMPDRPLFLPLGQLNATPATTGAAPAVERPAATAAGAATGGGGAGGVGAAGVAATEPAATGPATTTAASQPAARPPEGMPGWMLPGMLLLLGVFWIFTMRGKSKDEKKRKQLLADLKKGDKVMTIGGMVANVASVDGDEVVLKIDESANVKARYKKSAIQEVLTTEEKKERTGS